MQFKFYMCYHQVILYLLIMDFLIILLNINYVHIMLLEILFNQIFHNHHS